MKTSCFLSISILMAGFFLSCTKGTDASSNQQNSCGCEGTVTGQISQKPAELLFNTARNMWMLAYAEGPQYKKAYLICNTDHLQLKDIMATAPTDGTATQVWVSGRLKELCSADPGYSATCPAAFYLEIDRISK